MGILDFLNAPDAGMLNALYPSPLQGEADQAQQARDAAAAVLARRFRGGPGAVEAPPAALAPFAPGAVPLGFAGPEGQPSADLGTPSQPQLASFSPASAPPPLGAPASGVFPAVPAQPPIPSPATAQPAQASQPMAPPPLVPPVAPKPSVIAGNDDNEPDSFIPVGKYKMPAFAADDGETPAAAGANAPPTDVSAAGRAPATIPGFLQPTNSGGGFGSAARGAMANMQGGPLGMIGGAIAGAMGMGQGSPQDVQRVNQKAQYDALTGSGLTPQQAMLVILNPEAGKAIVDKTLAADKFQHVTRKDAFGGESIGAFDPTTGKTTFEGGGAAAGGAAFGGLLAQGVKYDPNKSGDDYMAQFSPEVQAAAKAYINGDVMPTGNARKDSVATFAKTVAQKYGQDTGVPVTDYGYAAKRKMQTDLASSSNSTMGGILSNGESSFRHLAEYTVSAVDQGNASHNFPLGGVMAHGQNWVGNTLGGSDTQGKVKAINDNLGKYGAESTKFYAGTGGGVEERLNALKEMNATTTSGEEAAAYAEKEKSLMLDRLNTKFQEIRNALGEERGNAEIAKHMPDIQKNIAKIDANVAKLRGQPAPAQVGAPTNILPPGNYAWSPKTGIVGGK